MIRYDNMFLSIIVFFLLGYIILLWIRIKKAPNQNCLIRFLAALFLIILFTLIREASSSDVKCIFLPFSAFLSIWKSNWFGHGQYIFYALVGNLLLFIPLGLSLSFIEKTYRIFLISLLISLSVETIQFVLSLGTFEVDDIICNCIGGFTGAELGFHILGRKRGNYAVIGIYLAALGLVCLKSILFS